MKQIKCGICGGPPNKLYYDSCNSETMKATFIMECWDGMNGKAPRHYTLLTVKLAGKSEFDHITTLEAEIERLKGVIAEMEKEAD